MKKIVFILLIGGVAFVLCALQGIVNVPGLTPTSPAPEAQKLEPPKDAPAEKAPAGPAPAPRQKESGAPALDVKKLEPPPEAKKSAYPPIKPADLERARTLYLKADF